MPTFRAVVGTVNGERMTIEKEAASAASLCDELDERGLFVIEVNPAATGGKAVWSFLFDRFSPQDLLELTTSLQSLVRAGIPVYQSLEIINHDEENPYRRRLVANIIHDLAHGLSLSEALAKYPTAFPVFYVRTVQASEATGTLAETLDRLASVIRRNERIRRRASSAVIYPALLFCLMLGIAALMLGYVFPTMESFFSSYGVDLPWDTRLLLSLSRWFRTHVIQCLVCGFAFFYVLWRIYKAPSLRPLFDKWRYDIPVLGKLFRDSDISLVSRTVAALVQAGVPANEALATAEETTDNLALAGQLRQTRLRIERGEAASSAAGTSGLLDPRACRVLRVGEESGSLARSFSELASYCEQRLESATERFLALLEPAIVIMTGLMILALLVTIIRPMTEALGRL